jgi:hypothetical protein
VSSERVLTTLDALADVTRQIVEGHHDAQLDADTEKVARTLASEWEARFRRAVEAMSEWCVFHDLPELHRSILPEGVVARFRELRHCQLGPRTSALARGVCLLWWLREVGLVYWGSLGWDSEWPPNCWPLHIDLPRTAWKAADGMSTGDAWMVEPVAAYRHYQPGERELGPGPFPGEVIDRWIRSSRAVTNIEERILSRMNALASHAEDLEDLFRSRG